MSPHHRHPTNGQPPPPPPSNGQLLASPAAAAIASSSSAPPSSSTSSLHKLAIANEETWLMIGNVAESMGMYDRALTAYECALRHNPSSVAALTNVANVARLNEKYSQAVDHFTRVLSLQPENGEVWSSLGHCYLMQDDLQKAYQSYQQALFYLPNAKEDPKLWYGIGILYDRYGSLEHAEEAFNSVLRMDKDFEKANEILFRLGIIYKQQGKFQESLDCFDRILRSPPSPLAHVDIWFQIGHVYEQQKDYVRAKEAYERVVTEAPNHAKVLQQLGWLYHQQQAPFQNQDLAVRYLTKSLEADASDAQSWYLLGRAYMAGQKYSQAYEAYQQAVYRDGRNPTFWCSIGVLYFQISQYRDALDAYSRAIRINPYISEVWFDLGSLYESCNNQISDAMDAYERAAELDPSNPHITQRLALLKQAQATGGQLPAAPVPKDVHPTAYASTNGNHSGAPAVPPLLQGRGSLFQRAGSRGPGELPNPGAAPPQSHRGSSPGPFRGGPPPPIVLDEPRRAAHAPSLAPMSLDRSTHREREHEREREPRREREREREHDERGRAPLLLHHPAPQAQSPHAMAAGRPASRYDHRARSPPSPPYRRRYEEPPQRQPTWDRTLPAMRTSPQSQYSPPREHWDPPPARRYDPRHDAAPPPLPPPQEYVRRQMSPAPSSGSPQPDKGRKRQREKEERESPESAKKSRRAPKPRAESRALKEEPADPGKPGSSSFPPSERATPLPPVRRKDWSPAPAPRRTLDEDYDEGVADALIGLATYRAPPQPSAALQEEKRQSPSPAETVSVESNGKKPPELPPIATLSPTSTASGAHDEDRMQVDEQTASLPPLRRPTHSPTERERASVRGSPAA